MLEYEITASRIDAYGSLVHCKEATQAFHTKTKGRSHSNYAVQLLSQYHISELREQ